MPLYVCKSFVSAFPCSPSEIYRVEITKDLKALNKFLHSAFGSIHALLVTMMRERVCYMFVTYLFRPRFTLRRKYHSALKCDFTHQRYCDYHVP